MVVAVAVVVVVVAVFIGGVSDEPLFPTIDLRGPLCRCAPLHVKQQQQKPSNAHVSPTVVVRSSRSMEIEVECRSSDHTGDVTRCAAGVFNFVCLDDTGKPVSAPHYTQTHKQTRHSTLSSCLSWCCTGWCFHPTALDNPLSWFPIQTHP